MTLSRGFSPHSAARLPKDRRAVRYFHFSNGSIAHKSPNCKEIPVHSDPRLSILRYLGCPFSVILAVHSPLSWPSILRYLGLSLGVLFGLMDNIGLGMMIGVDVGLCGGSAAGAPKGRKKETSDEGKEKGEK